MNIVEVQFIKDTQSQYTGNEFYRTGTRAHFYSNQAAMLVKQGRAEYCQPPVEEDVSLPVPPASVLYDWKTLDEMTVKELKIVAELRGVSITSKMRKAELIAALED